MQQYKQTLHDVIEARKADYIEICDTLFSHPELSEQEHFASSYLKQKLTEQGFSIFDGYRNLPTAFHAQAGEGGLCIAFAAEYDALPGYSSTANNIAHACGHNWIAAAAFGAASALHTVVKDLSCRIVVLGTPAEETVGSKVDMIAQGAFDDIDAMFQTHLWGKPTALFPTSLAMDALEITFHGKAAHAANNPQDGINALDAVNLLFAGINALRQHIPGDARIHGIITDGGAAANIVPAKSVCRLYVRAKNRAQCDKLTQKVLNCAKGAELMTGASHTYHFCENRIDDIQNDPALISLLEKNLAALGQTEICRTPTAPFGSTDIGNVSHVCPTAYIHLFAGNTDQSDIHEEAFLQHVNSPLAHEKLLLAIESMAQSALDLILENI